VIINDKINLRNEPENQNQHRLSQVYLKQFGYKKGDDWMISVFEAEKRLISNFKIAEFSSEVNIFDLPFKEPNEKRHFENVSNKIETRYRTIISNLQNQKMLTLKDNDVLNHFVANILCKTDKFRTYIDFLLRDSETRNKFINEITYITDNSKQTSDILTKFKIKYQLNLIIGVLMNHLVNIFRKFSKVIIRSDEELGWFTTDNPVIIDKYGNFDKIIPIESEIFMPLSKEYCLMMFHENSTQKSNPLRKLKQNQINKVGNDLFYEISSKIAFNLDKYLIFNIDFEDTEIEEINLKDLLNFPKHRFYAN
jgi:hypothetical protein